LWRKKKTSLNGVPAGESHHVSFLVPWFPSKSGLIKKHTVKHTVKAPLEPLIVAGDVFFVTRRRRTKKVGSTDIEGK
jgi:hypothetical protein